MANKMLSLASELKDLRCKWQTLSIYERFEQTVLAELTTVIAIIVVIASWQLLGTRVGGGVSYSGFAEVGAGWGVVRGLVMSSR